MRDEKAGDRYKSRNLRDHVRQRPDLWLGPITQAQHENVRVYDEESNLMRYETLTYSRALVQIVQEVLTNAGDQEHKDPAMRTIRITVPECSESRDAPIVVENDGLGIPILQKDVVNNQPEEICEENDQSEVQKAKRAKKSGKDAEQSTKVWIPTLCFAHERSGDNFDDTETRWTGGRNGLGSKLSNVLSTRFTVDVKDPIRHKQFSQTWEDGMARATRPSIRAHKAKTGMVRVSMLPEYQLFGYENGQMDETTRRLIITRVFDLAACTGKRVRVLLNGKAVGVRTFEDYGNVVFGSVKKQWPRVYMSHSMQHEQKIEQHDSETGERTADKVEQVSVLRMEMLLAAATPAESEKDADVVANAPHTVPGHVGFVNGLPCNDGTHVDYLLGKVVSLALDHLRKSKSKKDAVLIPGTIGEQTNDTEDDKSQVAFNAGRMFCDYSAIKPQMVKQHLRIAVKVLIDNPEFASQTKECLTRLSSKWGFTPKFDAARVAADLQKIGVMRLAMEEAMLAQQRSLGRQMSKKSAASGTAVPGGGRGLLARPNVPKYDHAIKAGHKNQHNVLILTEGDSAKQLAVAGKRVTGSDNFGIFPLRGKLKNVSDMTMAQLMKSKEINDIVTILGGFGPSIQTPKQLRYQQIFLFVDADPDGSHIGLLIIAALRRIFPTVVANFPSFMVRFATPIRAATLTNKAQAKKKPHLATLFFLSVAEHDEWLRTGRIPVVNQTDTYAEEDENVWCNDALEPRYDGFPDSQARLAAYSIQYLKGLGTSTAAMALRYFRTVRRYITKIDCTSPEALQMLDMLTRKKGADDRKRWFSSTYDPAAHVDYNRDTMTFSDFATGEYSHYINDACGRAIPRVTDGLKPTQAKILHALLHCGASEEKPLKVVDAAGIVSTRTGYHHGDASLNSAIVTMAQNHIGTNNINLLYPSGMFGSRLDTTTTHAAPRYIFTFIERISRAIFRAEDDPVLLTQYDEGKFIEPQHFAPIIPFALINGASGIGVGFATSVPAFHPLQVTARTRTIMKHYCQWVNKALGQHESKDSEDAKFSLITLPEEMLWDERRTTNDAQSGAFVSCDLATLNKQPCEQERAAFQGTQLEPWYDQFTGDIKPNSDEATCYTTFGRFERLEDGVHVRVTELPVGRWKDSWLTQIRKSCAYVPAGTTTAANKKAKINTKAVSATENDDDDDGNDDDDNSNDDASVSTASRKRKAPKSKKPKQSKTTVSEGFYLSDEDMSTDLIVNVLIKCNAESLSAMSDDELLSKLHLTTSLPLTNMVLYDRKGRIKRYRDIDDIICDFVVTRHFYYELRKDHLLKRMAFDARIVRNQHRFIKMVVEGQLVIIKRSDADLVNELATLKFERVDSKFHWVNPLCTDTSAKLIGALDAETTADNGGPKDGSADESKVTANNGYGGYDYLLKMPLASLTERKWRALCKRAEQLEEKIAVARDTSIEQMWSSDLDDFEKEYSLFLERKSECLAQEDEETTRKLNNNGRKSRKAPANKRKR